MTKIINLWAGPGAGKSTIAAQLFSELKWAGVNVELVTEAAKEIVWEKHHNLLEDQFYVSAMQNRRLRRLVGQVDYIVTDSPLLLCDYYAKDYPASFHEYMRTVWDSYDNVSFLLTRQKAYNPIGRMQDEAGARAIDAAIADNLNRTCVPYTPIIADNTAAMVIKNLVISQ